MQEKQNKTPKVEIRWSIKKSWLKNWRHFSDLDIIQTVTIFLKIVISQCLEHLFTQLNLVKITILIYQLINIEKGRKEMPQYQKKSIYPKSSSPDVYCFHKKCCSIQILGMCKIQESIFAIQTLMFENNSFKNIKYLWNAKCSSAQERWRVFLKHQVLRQCTLKGSNNRDTSVHIYVCANALDIGNSILCILLRELHLYIAVPVNFFSASTAHPDIHTSHQNENKKKKIAKFTVVEGREETCKTEYRAWRNAGVMRTKRRL